MYGLLNRYTRFGQRELCVSLVIATSYITIIITTIIVIIFVKNYKKDD